MPLEGGLVALELAGTTQVLSKCLQGAPSLLETPHLRSSSTRARARARLVVECPQGMKISRHQPSPHIPVLGSMWFGLIDLILGLGRHNPIVIRSDGLLEEGETLTHYKHHEAEPSAAGRGLEGCD
jgi:hypothetical protein